MLNALATVTSSWLHCQEMLSVSNPFLQQVHSRRLQQEWDWDAGHHAAVRGAEE
jgi:hypothetical protein